MKHSLKITIILIFMFVFSQLAGIGVISLYSPDIVQQTDESGNLTNVTQYHMPFGTNPPKNVDPGASLISIVIAIFIAICAMLLLMHLGVPALLRTWFFVVVIVAMGISINSIIQNVIYSSWIALLISIPLAYIKVFRRNILIHNLTEILIYPGIAAIFVPLLNVWAICVLLVIISIYDIYAVWHAGFMQKMAKYQIQKVKVFGGFFVPYLGKKERELINNAKKSNYLKKLKKKKIKVNIAILGGGDIVFPMILAGVVFNTLGLIPALIIIAGATAGLAYLFHISEKGKFYPAMPFISAGCFIALLVAYLI